MDVILELADNYFLDNLYARLLPLPSLSSSSSSSGLEYLNSTAFPTPYAASTTYGYSDSALSSPISRLPRDSMLRQGTSLFFLAWIGSAMLYFFFSGMSYHFFFDKRLKHHPKFLHQQIYLEIKSSMIAMPTIAIMTLPWFIGEVRGHSLLYSKVEDYGWTWMVVSTLLYAVFNDVAIYWIHRIEHHKSIYKYIHKPHHRWIIATPWAALAFHPLDGYAQSLPYHIFVFICPMHKKLYLGLFVAVQLWTILIHESSMIEDTWWQKFINSPSHHTLHHLYFKDNLGQYFTVADKIFSTHRDPAPELDPIHEALRAMKAKGLIDEEGREIQQYSQKKDL